MILEEIIPDLPAKEVLDRIRFTRNQEGLSVWDGIYYTNEALRHDVIKSLEESFRKKSSHGSVISRH